MVKRKKPTLTLRKAKHLAQHMIVSGLLTQAIGKELERRGLKPNGQFKVMVAANDISKKLAGVLPQLGMQFYNSDTSFPYTVYRGGSAPFILATPTVLAEAEAHALGLSDEFYASLAVTAEVATEVAP
jgi:hypothetical protein